MRSLADRIDDLLPQTQCMRCGYPDCRAYAEAIARDDAAIDRCPPGGAEGIERLAALTGREASPLALDPACGTEGPRSLAVIDEAWCIGCTLCLDACPTDAILGINKHMHTVMEAHCTGCELCVPVCPVDCIALEVATPGLSGWRAWSATQAEAARRRHDAHRARQARAAAAIAVPLATPIEADAAAARKRAVVAAALARAAATHRPPSADKP